MEIPYMAAEFSLKPRNLLEYIYVYNKINALKEKLYSIRWVSNYT